MLWGRGRRGGGVVGEGKGKRGGGLQVLVCWGLGFSGGFGGGWFGD